MAKFQQIHLNDWERGPFVPIAIIGPEPPELNEICQIEFHEIMEDLGLMDIAFIELPNGIRFLLHRYRDCPGPGTTIEGFKDVPDISQSVGSLLQAIVI